MLKAGDIIFKRPRLIDGRAAACSAVKALLAAPERVLVTVEKREWQRPVTLHSLAGALAKNGGIEGLTASDLADIGGLPVSPGTPVESFFQELQLRGALPVRSEGLFTGVVTEAGLALKLNVSLLELEREFNAVINFSSDEILVADGTGIVLKANALFEEHFGVKPAMIIGKSVEELERKRIFFPSVTRRVLNTKTAQTVIQTHRDGRTLLATGTPAFNPDGSIFRVIVNTRDTTRLNRLKQKLEEAERLTDSYRQELSELRRNEKGRDELIYASPAMIALVKTAQKIASAGSTVLLTGESGSGKGIIARYIHRCSPRANKPFTVVNCGAIPDNLLESELFGYTGGAFTGARREGKMGKLELANEGTLFFDEIAELPLNLQVKLLHVLQEGSISRIGGTREIQLNLRFIAATNRDIARMVEEGRFREDLFFRLDVIPMEVPPLRSRAEDIEALLSLFLERHNRKYAKSKRFSAEVIDRLKKYHWPGNVRELENLVERMMIIVDDELINLSHLPRHIAEKGKQAPLKTGERAAVSLKEAREELERDMLSTALRSCKSTYEMAELLEMHQSTVARKLKKYNLGRHSC